MKHAVFAFILFLLCNTSHAQFYIEESFFPIFKSSNTSLNDYGGAKDAPGVKSDSGFGYDSRMTLGYLIDMRWFIGLSFNMYSEPTSRTAVEGGLSSSKKNINAMEYGPTIGIFWSGFHFNFNYLMQGTKTFSDKQVQSNGTVDADYKVTNYLGSGFQIILGYSFPITPNFEIGPTLVYRDVRYGKQTLRNKLDSTSDYTKVSLYTDVVETSITPLFSMFLKF